MTRLWTSLCVVCLIKCVFIFFWKVSSLLFLARSPLFVLGLHPLIVPRGFPRLSNIWILGAHKLDLLSSGFAWARPGEKGMFLGPCRMIRPRSIWRSTVPKCEFCRSEALYWCLAYSRCWLVNFVWRWLDSFPLKSSTHLSGLCTSN